MTAPRLSRDVAESKPSRRHMSIYTTLWHLLFPRYGDAYVGCEWVHVFAQGVPAHLGTPTLGYESGDPFAAFLPPALRIEDDVSEDDLRAVVFVASASKKGTARSGQEYELPLLVLAGTEYAEMPFQELHDRLCSALRGTRPRLALEVFQPGGNAALVFEDGSITPITVDNDSTTSSSPSEDAGGRREEGQNGPDHDQRRRGSWPALARPEN